LLFSNNALLSQSQCNITSPVVIQPATTTTIDLIVENLQFSDLTSDQSLCRVLMEWEHGRQPNLRINLISPAGQSVTLVGPGIIGGNLSPLVNWTL